MNQNKNQTKNIYSITMDLENLRKKYSNLLIKYQAAISEYNTYLNNTSQNKTLVTIKGQAFNGTGSAGTSNATNLQDCVASCSSSPQCTGATFVSNKCSIRTGDSPLVASSPDSYAIIPKVKQILLNMEDINKQLLDVNAKITEKIKIATPDYEKTNKESELKNKELIANYEKLLDERRSIVEKLNEYEYLDNTENEKQIITTKNYYTYILLTILAVVVIILFYKILEPITSQVTPIIRPGGELGISAYFIVFLLIIFIIILRFAINYLTI